MLMDEKVDQWNSTESLDTGPNPNKKLVHDKAVLYISRPKKKKDYSINGIRLTRKPFALGMYGGPCMYESVPHTIKPKQTPDELYIYT